MDEDLLEKFTSEKLPTDDDFQKDVDGLDLDD